MNPRPVIVISATRFFQGGTLVIVNECLKFLSSQYSSTHRIKALVYKKELYDDIPGIDWVEFPDSRKSIFNRLTDEYIRFNRLSKKWQPELWLSLQDSTPRVVANISAVYYHNPLLLESRGLKLWKYQPRLAVLRLLYKYVYTRGINTNDFVITQQAGIARHLQQSYHLNKDKIRVFPPVSYLSAPGKAGNSAPESLPLIPAEAIPRCYTFIYPATAFYYKNHSLILKACRILHQQGLNFRVWLTIDGTENKHVKKLVAAAKKTLPQIQFLGFLTREDLFGYYARADCLVFPSLLESWGLPLTEFAAYNKPILCADLPYGRSTMAAINYAKVAYFDPVEASGEGLAAQMMQAAQGRLVFTPAERPAKTEFQQIITWADCFNELLPGKH